MSDFAQVAEPYLGVKLISGALSGLTVDLVLYPIDTIKTRLQSVLGILKTGGSHPKTLFRGVSSVALGGAPSAAIFWCVYRSKTLDLIIPDKFVHIKVASIAVVAEAAACSIRVPTEVVKQRCQVTRFSPLQVFRQTYATDGLRGLYQGYSSTMVREAPFAVIQFTLWEWLLRRESNQRPPYFTEELTAGAISGSSFTFLVIDRLSKGGVAGFLTTPVDVAKTRIMLAKSPDPLAKGNVFLAFRRIVSTTGYRGLFAGCIARTLYLSIGGCVFLTSNRWFLRLFTPDDSVHGLKAIAPW